MSPSQNVAGSACGADYFDQSRDETVAAVAVHRGRQSDDGGAHALRSQGDHGVLGVDTRSAGQDDVLGEHAGEAGQGDSAGRVGADEGLARAGQG